MSDDPLSHTRALAAALSPVIRRHVSDATQPLKHRISRLEALVSAIQDQRARDFEARLNALELERRAAA